MSKVIRQVWTFRSASNPDAAPHETLQYTDGSTSCTCKGWTLHVSADGCRSCTHTRKVDMGQANSQAASTIRYSDDTHVADDPTNTAPVKKKKPQSDQPSLFVNKRKFA